MTIHSRPPTASKFERFLALHQGFFITPTIWDSLSALAAEEAGFEAVATSSAALGYANGILSSQRAPLELVVERLGSIAKAVGIPVSVDLEDGYPEAAGGIGDSIRRIIDAGVVAANIEDSPGSHSVPLVPADSHARVIEQAQEAAIKAGAGFFVNARTDVFMLETGQPHYRSVEEAIRRANRYLEAGADGVYVPAKSLGDDEVGALAKGIRGPLTLLSPPEGRPFGHWRELGVNRISLGTLVIRNAYAAIQSQLADLRDSGVVRAFPAVDIDGALKRAQARVAG